MSFFSAISQYLAKCSPKISEDKRIARVRNRRVHMANERTFLSWIRTSIGIMAFGFVVEKFGIFIKQFSSFMSSVRAQQDAYYDGKDICAPYQQYSVPQAIQY